jgi:hypothetical protein
VPSLKPAATQRLWRRLVRTRRTRTFRPQATADCRPLRAVFYAASDWLRLATKLAANASPCAQYYISIPPLAADKTRFRTDQAWRIRAVAPNLHALAEMHMPGWRGWVTANGATWYQAGVEARRRMAAAGFDVTLGDSWIVNEFSSAVRRGLGTARADAREFVRGLYDGDGSLPATRGGVFDVGVGQSGIGPGAADIWAYKSQLEGWLEDDAFWSDMSRYVSDWSQELYGDPCSYAVAGAPLATRRDYLNEFLQHEPVHAGLGPAAVAAARSFFASAYSPLANAAWEWSSGFGWTMIAAEQMQDYVSAQTYALRSFDARAAAAQDHWGFAWAPHNGSGMTNDEFVARTGAILDRLAAAIHDSGEPVDPDDPGIGACAPAGENLWCNGELPGASFTDVWKAFTYWGQLALAFATPAQTLTAGSPSAPITLQLQLAGAAHATPTATGVTLSSSSPRGIFSTSPSGPWTSTLTLSVAAGSDTSPPFYYADTAVGAPLLTASAPGTIAGAQTETVVPGALAALTVSPSAAAVVAGGSQPFAAIGADAYGNAVSVAGATWSVSPTTLGAFTRASGTSTTFTAAPNAGTGSVVVSLRGVSGSASIVVNAPPPPATPPPPPAVVAPQLCVVPKLRGKTLLAARQALKRRHCALGPLRRAYSRTIRRGRVISQRPAPGTRRPRGTKISVVVSRGSRTRR